MDWYGFMSIETVFLQLKLDSGSLQSWVRSQGELVRAVGILDDIFSSYLFLVSGLLILNVLVGSYVIVSWRGSVRLKSRV